MGVVQPQYPGRMCPNPRDLEVVSASATDPSIVLCKLSDVWSYQQKADEWRKLPDIPSGRKPVSVIASDPPTVICTDGAVLKLVDEKWQEGTPLPGSVAHEREY